MNQPFGGFGVYIHLPWCVEKCPYCDFNSYALHSRSGLQPSRETRYVAALRQEIQFFRDHSPWRDLPVGTVSLGGGTPSLFSGTAIAEILGDLRRSFDCDTICEITLEANPGTIREPLDFERLAAYREAGVNRISFGCQSFSPKKLQALGRIHSPDDIPRAIAAARSAGFDNLNVDLMFGVRDETVDEWKNDLRSALALSPEHISLYSLTIEPGTVFDRRARKGDVLTVDEDRSRAMYEAAVAAAETAGLQRYEVSNFARPGHECRHNLGYWRGIPYLGLGAGAHGFYPAGHLPPETFPATVERRGAKWGVRWRNIPGPDDYLQRADANGSAAHATETLTREQALLEFFFLRLRTREGARLDELERRFGLSLEQLLGPALKRLIDEQLVSIEDGQFKTTADGMLVLDSLLELVAKHIEQRQTPLESH
ncbi:MAG: radical SAM family heme chaperone HemW [Bdellovibrionales bacterium]|nr:radical SAM family heme chaperone HemW [Bdellovibrionales bacterium]